MLRKAWHRLRHQYFSGSLILQTGEGLAESDVAETGNVWVVARDHCVFRTIDLTGVPTSKFDSVVQAQIQLFSPFSDPGFFWLPGRDKANVWIWDEARQRQFALKHELSLTDYQIIPESCFSPRGSGFSLVTSIGRGCFTVLRDDGEIVTDSWWPETPTESEWRNFLRGLSLSASGTGSEAVNLPTPEISGKNVWPEVRLRSTSSRTIERLLLQTMVVVFAVLFAFQLAGSLRLVTLGWSLDSHLEDVRTTHQATIDVRDQALLSRDRAKQLSQLGSLSQVNLMEQVATLIPGRELRVWQYGDGELEMVVRDQNPDLENYVRLLEALAQVESVTLEPLTQSGELRIRAVIIDG